MKTALLALGALATATTLTTQSSPTALLQKHAEKLQAAKSFKVQFTVQIIGGASEDHRLTLAKPDKLRWEAPDKTVVMDGKTMWVYTKATKSYTETAITDGTSLKVLGDNRLWMWSAFFDPKFRDQIASSKLGKPRRMKQAATTEVQVVFSKRTDAALTLFVDDALGVARGGLWKTPAGEMIISAEPIALADSEPDAKLFAFNPPADAKKVDASAVAANAIPYNEIQAIFFGNCTGCHGTGQQRSGLNLSNYDSVMRGGRGGKIIEPGNPGQSRILKYLRGQGSPVMPPGRPMPTAVIDKIEAWIASGANKE